LARGATPTKAIPGAKFGDLPADPFPGEKPVLRITAANAEQYANKLKPHNRLKPSANRAPIEKRWGERDTDFILFFFLCRSRGLPMKRSCRFFLDFLVVGNLFLCIKRYIKQNNKNNAQI
ncbi:hypothetical protein, partial [Pseudomonas sp. BEA3.1]|uniref:hypothetical protein n=1 Tax=Pseudomonas sp. BEA3.1 TaxID=3083251 RepID=UPI002964EA13